MPRAGPPASWSPRCGCPVGRRIRSRASPGPLACPAATRDRSAHPQPGHRDTHLGRRIAARPIATSAQRIGWPVRDPLDVHQLLPFGPDLPKPNGQLLAERSPFTPASRDPLQLPHPRALAVRWPSGLRGRASTRPLRPGPQISWCTVLSRHHATDPYGPAAQNPARRSTNRACPLLIADQQQTVSTQPGETPDQALAPLAPAGHRPTGSRPRPARPPGTARLGEPAPWRP